MPIFIGFWEIRSCEKETTVSPFSGKAFDDVSETGRGWVHLLLAVENVGFEFLGFNSNWNKQPKASLGRLVGLPIFFVGEKVAL